MQYLIALFWHPSQVLFSPIGPLSSLARVENCAQSQTIVSSLPFGRGWKRCTMSLMRIKGNFFFIYNVH